MVMKFENEPEWQKARLKIFELFYKSDVQTILKTATDIIREQQFKNGEWETTTIKLIFEVDGYIIEYEIRETSTMLYVFWEVKDFLTSYGNGMDTLYDILEKANQIFKFLK